MIKCSYKRYSNIQIFKYICHTLIEIGVGRCDIYEDTWEITAVSWDRVAACLSVPT